MTIFLQLAENEAKTQRWQWEQWFKEESEESEETNHKLNFSEDKVSTYKKLSYFRSSLFFDFRDKNF